METDKFEQHIRTKLQEREIEPSSNAWERISNELNTGAPSKKPIYLWMGIAASIVVLLGLTLYYFNSDIEELDVHNKVVQTNKETPLEVEQEKTVVSLESEQAMVRSASKSEEVLGAHDNIGQSKKSSIVVSNVDIQNETGVAVLDQLGTKDSAQVLKFPEQIINDKVVEIIAQVNILEQYNTVTDAEVDSLLKRAQEEILRDKIFKTETSVDAMALLTAVEDELDQSFRDQIFNSLKAGFIKVRTAVADRNN